MPSREAPPYIARCTQKPSSGRRRRRVDFVPSATMPTRLTTVLVSLLLAGALVACDDGQGDHSPQDASPGTEVDVVDNRFEPEAREVQPGDTVTWTWHGSNPHDVVGDGFESDVLTTGAFSHTFDSPGEYPYVCTIHAGMDGLIVVEDE